LHVIEAPRPVDHTVRGLSGFRVQGSGFRVLVLGSGFSVRGSGFSVRGSRFDDVPHRTVVFVDNVDHSERAERAGVEGLAARRGIERGSIERDRYAAVALGDAADRRVKLSEIRVGVIEAVGHRVSCWPWAWTMAAVRRARPP